MVLCVVIKLECNTDMFRGSFSTLRLISVSKIAQNILTGNVFCRTYSVCGNLVQIEKRKLIGNGCIQARNLHMLKNINRTVICSGVNGGTVIFFREKYTNKYTKRPEYDSDSDSDSDNEVYDGVSKMISVTVGSMRVDLIIKKGLGLARNKVEKIFYESRVRVNGKKIPKKSVPLKVTDEVDVIKGVSPVNPEFLSISRLVIRSAKPTDSDDNEEGIVVKLQKYKTLYVENYEEPWKKTSTE